MTRSLAAFKADVTSEMSFAVPQDAVRPPGTLHLTLGVMSLKQETVERAVEVLKALKLREVLSDARRASWGGGRQIATGPEADKTKTAAAADRETGGLSITMRGLSAMQSPSRTSVVYAPPTDAEGVLSSFCERVKRPFQDASLMGDDGGRPLLLHATVINTIYVKGRRREKLLLDVRDILSKYDDYVWLEDMPVAGIALCRMGAKAVGEEGDQRYEVEAEVGF